ncbi:hypothetical protein [Paucilactobacillus sp. N302-9]
MNKDNFHMALRSISGEIVAFVQKSPNGILPDNAIDVTDLVKNAIFAYCKQNKVGVMSSSKESMFYSDNPDEIAELESVHQKYVE